MKIRLRILIKVNNAKNLDTVMTKVKFILIEAMNFIGR